MILTPKGKISTSKKALMENTSEFVKKLLRDRELTKWLKTYLKPIKENLDSNDRLHSTFNQGKTVTGRLSSSDPINFQNIPSRTEQGRKIRELFIPSEGYKLLVADFSQIELRVLAHYSQDKNLVKAYKENVDVHNQTAKAIFKKDTPTNEERFIGKTINFSVSYGAGPKKLAETINSSGLAIKVTEEETQALLERFGHLYPGLGTWKRQVWWTTRQTGYIRTLLGRKIPIIGFHGNMKEQFEAQRTSVSYLIQGSAADIMKQCILNLPKSTRIISTVHDELLIEIADPLELILITAIMENCVQLSVPLVVDAKIVDHWGQK